MMLSIVFLAFFLNPIHNVKAHIFDISDLVKKKLALRFRLLGKNAKLQNHNPFNRINNIFGLINDLDDIKISG